MAQSGHEGLRRFETLTKGPADSTLHFQATQDRVSLMGQHVAAASPLYVMTSAYWETPRMKPVHILSTQQPIFQQDQGEFLGLPTSICPLSLPVSLQSPLLP